MRKKAVTVRILKNKVTEKEAGVSLPLYNNME